MRAIVQDVYGEADVLRLAEIDRPEPGPGEVLLRVRAAGVDRGAWHLMAGLPYPVRLAGYGLRAPKARVRGRELAGVVEAVGPGVAGPGVAGSGEAVTGLGRGEEVFGIGEGCFAEYAVARADLLLPRPAALPPEQAAALPISGLTALQAVRDQGRVRSGERVLVIGASGGVGTFAVQVAKAFGAEVTGVCRTSKIDLVRTLGADHVVDHTREPLRGTYDVVLDIGGNRRLRELRGLLVPRGRLVIVGGETDGRLLGGTDRQLRALLLAPFVRQTMRAFVSSENAADLGALVELVGSGAVTPAVDRTFPLDETPAAIRRLADGHARGKVVVTV
ncbi:MAG: NAD(P)-dependent alcohol dehydrogenase [Pseudonocardia sp.]|nr:NAD(P)-dependent alcohol dehydrogenase [Pseudonocardia sp.]